MIAFSLVSFFVIGRLDGSPLICFGRLSLIIYIFSYFFTSFVSADFGDKNREGEITQKNQGFSGCGQ